MDSLYKLAQIPNKGRGLIALQKLPKGQLLFAERPIVACMREQQLGKFCSYCYNPLTQSNEAEAFDTFHDDCHDIGWQTVNYKYAGVRNRDYQCVDDKKFPIMARIVLAHTLQSSLNGEPSLWDGILGHLCYANNTDWVTDKTAYTEWIQFVSSKSDIKREQIEQIVPFEMHDRLQRILHLNCITVQYNEEDVATGLFGLGSMFNHSCDPNAELVTKAEEYSGYALFRTTREVSKDEELCIQYAGQNDSYEDRQKYLRWVYGFQCECHKCVAEKRELGVDDQQGCCKNAD